MVLLFSVPTKILVQKLIMCLQMNSRKLLPTQGLIAEDKGGNLLTFMFHYGKIKIVLKIADTAFFWCYTCIYLVPCMKISQNV